jgi:hypothetical protein
MLEMEKLSKSGHHLNSYFLESSPFEVKWKKNDNVITDSPLTIKAAGSHPCRHALL